MFVDNGEPMLTILAVMSVLSTLKKLRPKAASRKSKNWMKHVSGTPQNHNYQRKGTDRLTKILDNFRAVEGLERFYREDLFECMYDTVVPFIQEMGWDVTFLHHPACVRGNEKMTAAIQVGLAAAKISMKDLVLSKLCQARSALRLCGHIIRKRRAEDMPVPRVLFQN